MRRITLFLSGILLFGMSSGQHKTLEVNPAAGDLFIGSEYNISWTIGEGVIETFSNDNIVLTQGFQQPSLKITLIEESDKGNFEINVYPNPTSDFVTVNIVSEDDISCNTALYDMAGRLLYSKDLKGSELTESINLTKYSSDLYILRILDSKGKLLQTYKVQKIK